MDIKRINTIRELKEAGYQPKSIKEEIRRNLVKKLEGKEEKWCARRVGELYLVTGGNKFTTIPKTSPELCGQDINEGGQSTHYPAGNVIDFSKIHTGGWFNSPQPVRLRTGKNREGAKIGGEFV